MPQLTIQLSPCAGPHCCALCGEATAPAAGLSLFLNDGPSVVCRKCGKQHAPSLAALLDLAHVANRVGRIGRHTLIPPFEALLDLARAAEVYTSTSPDHDRRAA